MGGYKCDRCGEAVPEGLLLCPECMRQAGAGEAAVSAAEELRDVADVLSIEAGTDANIKQALQAILNIAARLERSVINGKAEEKALPRAGGAAQAEDRRPGDE